MSSIISISKRILKEIDSQTDDSIVRELAKDLLEFEIENWRLERVHFTDFYEKKILSQSQKRLAKI